MKSIAILLVIFIAACATQQSVTLLPRAPATERGIGVRDLMKNEITVTLDGRRYVGGMIVQTASTSRSIFTLGSTTTTNQASALLIGETGGQIRCDFGFDSMWTQATGVCVDYKNLTYDVLIKN